MEESEREGTIDYTPPETLKKQATSAETHRGGNYKSKISIPGFLKYKFKTKADFYLHQRLFILTEPSL
jgi:hypothetical protein